MLHKVWGLGFELALKTEKFLVAMLLLPVFLYQQSQIEYGIELTRLLPLAGLATLAPLLPYHLAIKRIDLSLLGFLQFIVPTINFVLAVFFLGEKFDTAKMIAFGGVWLAVAFFLIGERQSSDHLSPK